MGHFDSEVELKMLQPCTAWQSSKLIFA